MTDPLDSVVVDAQEVDRTRLAALLRGRIGVDGGSGEIVVLDGFENLNNSRAKILAYLLGRKAASLLGKTDQEGTGPSAISEALGIPKGTAGRILRELAAARLVVQDDQRKYRVPSHQLGTAEGVLSNAEEG